MFPIKDFSDSCLEYEDICSYTLFFFNNVKPKPSKCDYEYQMIYGWKEYLHIPAIFKNDFFDEIKYQRDIQLQRENDKNNELIQKRLIREDGLYLIIYIL
jgi:hypothetical protein